MKRTINNLETMQSNEDMVAMDKVAQGDSEGMHSLFYKWPMSHVQGDQQQWSSNLSECKDREVQTGTTADQQLS